MIHTLDTSNEQAQNFLEYAPWNSVQCLKKCDRFPREFSECNYMLLVAQRKMNGNKVFLKLPKTAFFSAQHVLDPLLSLYTYFFIPTLQTQTL